MKTLETDLPYPAPALRTDAGGPAGALRWSSRVRSVGACIQDLLRGYDDYFAEMERALPLHVREARRARRRFNHLLLTTMLIR